MLQQSTFTLAESITVLIWQTKKGIFAHIEQGGANQEVLTSSFEQWSIYILFKILKRAKSFIQLNSIPAS